MMHINQAGNQRSPVEVNGVRGSACRELVRETIEKLGVELSVELKPEYFDQAEEKEQEKNRF